FGRPVGEVMARLAVRGFGLQWCGLAGRACRGWACSAGRGSDRTAGGAGLWLAVVRACWPCLSRLGLLLPVGEVIAPLAVQGRAFAGGRSRGLAIPPRRYGALACLR